MERIQHGKLITITGPSGAGRGSVVEALRDCYSNFTEPPGVTTRAQRPGEVAGMHYYFVSLEEFEQGIKNEDYIFWDQHIGNYYGIYKSTVSQMLSERKYVILELPLGEDIYKVKKLYPDMISIYIIPPNTDSMVRHLIARENNNMVYVLK